MTDAQHTVYLDCNMFMWCLKPRSHRFWASGAATRCKTTRGAVRRYACWKCICYIYARKWTTITTRVTWLLLHAQTAFFAMYTSDGRMLTAKQLSFKLVITSHFSRHMQMWPRARYPTPLAL